MIGWLILIAIIIWTFYDMFNPPNYDKIYKESLEDFNNKCHCCGKRK